MTSVFNICNKVFLHLVICQPFICHPALFAISDTWPLVPLESRSLKMLQNSVSNFAHPCDAGAACLFQRYACECSIFQGRNLIFLHNMFSSIIKDRDSSDTEGSPKNKVRETASHRKIPASKKPANDKNVPPTSKSTTKKKAAKDDQGSTSTNNSGKKATASGNKSKTTSQKQLKRKSSESTKEKNSTTDDSSGRKKRSRASSSTSSK